jgi:hypothetical protein
MLDAVDEISLIDPTGGEEVELDQLRSDMTPLDEVTALDLAEMLGRRRAEIGQRRWRTKCGVTVPSKAGARKGSTYQTGLGT